VSNLLPRHLSPSPGIANAIVLLLLVPLLVVGGSFCPAAESPLVSAPQVTELTRAMRSDATLWDVHFADDKLGWAVGDRGAIWHTRDGGRRWEPQESGVACRLSRVEFVDPRVGWAAGGWTDPVSHVSRSVLLSTQDGGRTWTPIAVPMIGEFLELNMQDARNGWAIARGSAVFPSGILRTQDGGRGWSPAETVLPTVWQRGDLSRPELGILAGHHAQLAYLHRDGVRPSRTNVGGLREVRAMRMLNDHRGLLVGDGGLVMETPDGGGSWQPVASLPPDAAELFDWQTVATHEDKIWIAGQPGSYVLHSPDRGQTWQWHETGQTLPIRSLHFVDQRHGWAVGALGNILSTSDGGRSWQAQRSEASRLAWLGIFCDAKTIPLELVARLSAGEGYYGGVLTVGRRDFDPPQVDAHKLDRTEEAARVAGAGVSEQLWQFPLRQASLQMPAAAIEANWRLLHDGDGLQVLEEQLVRRIRMWRPTVIVTQSSSDSRDGATALLRQVLLRAVQAAADDQKYPVQIHDLKLTPWKVPKVYAISSARRGRRSGFSTAQFMPQLGKSLHGFVATARGLLFDDDHVPPTAYRFESLIDDARSGSMRDDLFAGRHLPPGGEARREAIAAPAIPLINLRRLADRRRSLPALLARADQDRHAGMDWQKKVTQLVADLDRPVAAEIVFQLATEYARAGHAHLAAETYTLVSELYPENALATAARLRLLQHHSSGEVRVGNQPQQASNRSTGGVRIAGGVIPVARGTKQVGLLQSEGASMTSPAIRWSGELKGLDASLYGDPRVQLPLAAEYRRLGGVRDAQRILLSLTRSRPHDIWWAVAGRELALLSRKDPKAKPDTAGAAPSTLPPAGATSVATPWQCVRAEIKPYLDGQLDEACWQAVAEQNDQQANHSSEIPLQCLFGEDTSWPAVARLAYDAEYLYFAVRCTKAAGVDYKKTEGPRQRDTDLANRDRVTLLLDVDRDYATYFELTVDSRGWIAERIGDNVHWNPEWFVAHSEDETSWTCEAAIPWTDLTGSVPAVETVWAAGIQRVVPGVGFQSASQPAAVKVRPEGFSHLRFD